MALRRVIGGSPTVSPPPDNDISVIHGGISKGTVRLPVGNPLKTGT
jgi:hypothetical protein